MAKYKGWAEKLWKAAQRNDLQAWRTTSQDHFMSTKSGSLEAKYKGMKGGSGLQHNDICQWFCFVAVVIIFKSTNLPPDILKEITACKNKFYLSFIWP